MLKWFKELINEQKAKRDAVTADSHGDVLPKDYINQISNNSLFSDWRHSENDVWDSLDYKNPMDLVGNPHNIPSDPSNPMNDFNILMSIYENNETIQ